MSGTHPDKPSSGDLTIADTVLQSGGRQLDHDGSGFDILLQALQAADLVDAVADPGADLTRLRPD